MVWSWDITELKGPNCFYYLYTIIDIFSRYVTGWMIADWERARLAEQLIAETCAKQGIRRDQLTLHSDRGSSMRSHTVAELLFHLHVAKSHSRPYTPTDNPYSEAQFKTMKYRPDYPGRFGAKGDALDWARMFFRWYNEEHHHVALGLMTPAAVHYGQAESIYEHRRQVLTVAYADHPERFVGGEPVPPKWAEEVWINPPQTGRVGTQIAAPEVSGKEPGAQAGSRARAQRSLDAAEHLATLERPPEQLIVVKALLPKL